MTKHATSSFTIDSWNEQVVLDENGKLVRTSITKTFSGDIRGTSVAEMIMAHAGGESAAYCGFERLTVTLDGKAGTFLVHHNATRWKGGGEATWTVMASSGTGELTGLRGTAKIDRHEDGSHRFSLAYDLE
jgi:Protein of unknown function (DUF3224)